jgi:hypothetical protein
MMSEGSSSGKRGGPEPKQEGPARRLRPDEIITPSHLNRVTRARAPPSVANGTFSAMRAAATGGCVTQRRDPAIPARIESMQQSQQDAAPLKWPCVADPKE